MCGICGLRRMGDQPLSRVMFEILLIENQKRGNHATGVAIQQADGAVDIYKKDVPAWTITQSPEYKKFMKDCLRDDSRTIIGHTRQATQGAPHINKNNHPLWDGITAVVHNGMIGNDDTMFRELKLKRTCETDSDIIRAVLDEYGFTTKGINILSKLSGSGAIAAVSTDYPGELLLARSGNPIVTASSDNLFIWSSELSAIIKCSRPFIKKFGLFFRKIKADLATQPMTDDSAWVLTDTPNKEGSFLKWHQEIHIATNFTPHNYEVNKTYFGMRVKYYDERPANVAICRNKSCGKVISLNPLMARNIKKICCSSCKTPLRAQV